MPDLPPDAPDDRPTLEMPSFSLRRRRRASEKPAADAPQPDEPMTVVPAQQAVEPEAVVEEPVAIRRRPRSAPPVAGLPAALLTGLVVGALAVAYAWLAGAGCEAVRGTSACGGAAGLPLLLAGLVLLAWAGALLLGFFRVPDAGSTSILAVGLLAVLVMLFLLDALDDGWAVVAVPVLAAGSYGLAWWVTASVSDEPGTSVPEPHDVR